MDKDERKKLKIIAIIPARGGSKGVRRKNIKALAGKPLIGYTIEAALKSKVFDRVVVSTEDEEIAEIAVRYGAEVIIRPAVLATDTAPTEPVTEHAVTYLEKGEDYKPDIIVLLQATSPFRNSKHIKEAMNEFLRNDYDSLLSVCPSHAFIWRLTGNEASPINYDFKNRPRKQDMLPEYRENGAIYITKHEILMKEHNRLGGKIGLYVMSEEDSLEIDRELDFWICEQTIIKKRV